MKRHEIEGARGGFPWGWTFLVLFIALVGAAAYLASGHHVEIDGLEFGWAGPFEPIVETLLAFLGALIGLIIGIIGAVIGIAAGIIGILFGLIIMSLALAAASIPLLLPLAIFVGIGYLIGRSMRKT